MASDGRPEKNIKVFGVINHGTYKKTATDGIDVYGTGSGNGSGGVVAVYNGEDGQYTANEVRQLTYFGETPSAEVLSRHQAGSGQAVEPKRTGQTPAIISLPIRLLSLKEKLDLRFPTSSKVQEIIDKVFKDRRIHVELRQKIEGGQKTLDPTKTLSQENITSGTTLSAYEVNVVTQQSTTSSVCSSKGTPV